MATREFNKKFLRDELDLPYSAIEDEITGNGRWSIFHSIVFEYEGKYYQTSYSEGATECQDESPWEYEDNVVCVEVEKREVKSMQWVDVDEPKEECKCVAVATAQFKATISNMIADVAEYNKTLADELAEEYLNG